MFTKVLYYLITTKMAQFEFTDQDKQILASYGVKVNRDLPIFIKEFYAYLKYTWCEQFHYELEPLKNNDLDEFNKIIGYPNSKGYAIIDDSFTGRPDKNSPKFSKTSKELLGWIYGIYLNE
jgi:hypothetical protein